MKNDAPILFRPNGRAFKRQPKSSAMGVFLDEEKRTLTIEGLTYSLDFLAAFAPKDEKPRGPFWVKRDGDLIALYELDPDFEQAAMQHKLQYEVGALNAQQAQQSAAMDAYCAGLLDEFNQPGRWVFPPSAERRGAEEGRKRAILSELAGREISMIETAKVLKALEPPKAETVFEDAFVYRPPVQKKKPFDWTLPLPEPWASRFTKLYVAMLMATPVYILIALFGV